MYIYLHGFASSPHSYKARYLRDRFQALSLPLQIPDLNQDDFTGLTLTRQLQQVRALFPPEPHPVTLIGSSFGGLTAAWLAEHHPQVQRLVVLAPAFHFLSHWLPVLGRAQVQRWQIDQILPIYHYGAQAELPLSYEFVRDLEQFDDGQIQRPVPTLILHGRQDEVIPIAASRQFASDRPWVQLRELESDHSLNNVSEDLWQTILTFLSLVK